MNTFIFLLPSFHRAIDLRSHRVIVFIMNFFCTSVRFAHRLKTHSFKTLTEMPNYWLDLYALHNHTHTHKNWGEFAFLILHSFWDSFKCDYRSVFAKLIQEYWYCWLQNAWWMIGCRKKNNHFGQTNAIFVKYLWKNIENSFC